MTDPTERRVQLANLALLLGLALVILGAIGYVGAQLDTTVAAAMLVAAVLLVAGGAAYRGA